MYHAAKRTTLDITLSYVKRWLLTQNVFTLHAPLRKHFVRRKTVVPGLYYQMQMDLVDLSGIKDRNKGYKYLLTAIDVFSRKAFVVPLKNKKDIEVKNAIAYIFSNYPLVQYVQTDSGREFYNSVVKSYLDEHNITLFSTSSDPKASIIERFNKTLKQHMFKYFTANKTLTYIPILQKLVSAYNNRKHRNIGTAPNLVTLGNQSEIWKKQYQNYFTGYRKGKFKYLVGDNVRISKLARQFRKGYLPTFTDEIFIVHDRLTTVPVMYKLRDHTGESSSLYTFGMWTKVQFLGWGRCVTARNNDASCDIEPSHPKTSNPSLPEAEWNIMDRADLLLTRW